MDIRVSVIMDDVYERCVLIFICFRGRGQSSRIGPRRVMNKDEAMDGDKVNFYTLRRAEVFCRELHNAPRY